MNTVATGINSADLNIRTTQAVAFAGAVHVDLEEAGRSHDDVHAGGAGNVQFAVEGDPEERRGALVSPRWAGQLNWG